MSKKAGFRRKTTKPTKSTAVRARKLAAADKVILQTSPITIGGGSITIDFDHGYYTGSGGRYTHPSDQLENVMVYDSRYRLKWDLFDFVYGKDCFITIHTRVNSVMSDIVIRSRPRGPLILEFDIREFPQDNANNRVHYHAQRRVVDSIEVVDRSDNSRATFSSPPDRCYFHILNLARP